MSYIKNKIIAILNARNVLADMFSAYDKMVQSIQRLFPGDTQKQMDNIAFIVSHLATATRFINLEANKIYSSTEFDIEDLTAIVENTFKFPANQRPSFEEYFMNIALMASMRASCYARKTGAVIVKGHDIVSIGYNGAPHWQNSCMHEGNCAKEMFRNTKIFELVLHNNHLDKPSVKSILKDSLPICPSPCAERSAISRLPETKPEDELSAYCTLFPCIHCAEALAKVPGMKKVYYAEDFTSATGTKEYNQKALKTLHNAGIEVIPLKFTPQSFNQLIFELIHPQGTSRARQKPFEALPQDFRDRLGL